MENRDSSVASEACIPELFDPTALHLLNQESLHLESHQRSMLSSATVSFLAAQRSMLQWFGRPRAWLGTFFVGFRALRVLGDPRSLLGSMLYVFGD